MLSKQPLWVATDNNEHRFFDELSTDEQAFKVLGMYKLALELSHHQSFWYRLLALAGHAGARGDQFAFTSGREAAVRIVNSSPDFQQAWRQLCDAEPLDSPARPFLKRVLRSRCIPLPAKTEEERQRGRAEAWAFSNQCQRLLDQLDDFK